MSKIVASNTRQKRQRKTVLSKSQLNAKNAFSASSMDTELENSNPRTSTTSKGKTSQLSDALKLEIINAPDAVVEIIYPLLGKIIKKYLNTKLDIIKTKFNLTRLSDKITGKSGIDYRDNIELNAHPQIEKVMLIEKESGTILSEFSNTLEISDVTSSNMLTKIFQSVSATQENHSNSDIKYIKYDAYTIHIQLVSNYFMAVIVSGPYNWTHRDVLEDKILNFAQRELISSDFKDPDKLTKKLNKVFRKKELIVH